MVCILSIYIKSIFYIFIIYVLCALTIIIVNTIFVESHSNTLLDILLNFNRTDANFSDNELLYQVLTIITAVSFKE